MNLQLILRINTKKHVRRIRNTSFPVAAQGIERFAERTQEKAQISKLVVLVGLDEAECCLTSAAVHVVHWTKFVFELCKQSKTYTAIQGRLGGTILSYCLGMHAEMGAVSRPGGG